jgi:peptidyl-prolyl cis-trans isomerase B (cyclophilin B)
VLWFGFIILLALVFLLLVQPWKNSGAATPVASTDRYMTIETAKGTIVAKLYTDTSAGVSKTIANFETKAAAGFFNGLTFHRVEDWVIQGGDPLGNGTGGGEMPSEYNKISFKAGALGVARGNDPAINNDSQFFITKTDATYLDGQYTNWGQVTQGMDVVSKIAIGDKITKLTITDKQP